MSGGDVGPLGKEAASLTGIAFTMRQYHQGWLASEEEEDEEEEEGEEEAAEAEVRKPLVSKPSSAVIYSRRC